MITKTDLKFFQKAKRVALTSDYNKIHVGCVATYKGKIIGTGRNSNKTHPLQKNYNRFRIPEGEDITMIVLPKIHAEIDCLSQIRGLDINYSKVKLYIYRVCNARLHGISRPCQSCMAAIKDMGIKNIYYTTDDGYVYEHLDLSKNHLSIGA